MRDWQTNAKFVCLFFHPHRPIFGLSWWWLTFNCKFVFLLILLLHLLLLLLLLFLLPSLTFSGCLNRPESASCWFWWPHHPSLKLCSQFCLVLGVSKSGEGNLCHLRQESLPHGPTDGQRAHLSPAMLSLQPLFQDAEVCSLSNSPHFTAMKIVFFLFLFI